MMSTIAETEAMKAEGEKSAKLVLSQGGECSLFDTSDPIFTELNIAFANGWNAVMKEAGHQS